VTGRRSNRLNYDPALGPTNYTDFVLRVQYLSGYIFSRAAMRSSVGG
jgi:hypothetical protein